MLINQRISSVVINRLNAIQARLDAGLSARDLCGYAITPSKLDPRLGWSAAPGTLAGPRFASPAPIRVRELGPMDIRKVTLTRQQMVINQRISLEALRRAKALEKRIMGNLTGGDFRAGEITQDALADRMRITSAPAEVMRPPASRTIKPTDTHRSKRPRVSLSVAQMIANQRIDSDAMVIANRLISRLNAGVTSDMIADGSITTENLAPQLRVAP